MLEDAPCLRLPCCLMFFPVMLSMSGSAETDLDYILRLSVAAAFSLTSGEHAAVMLAAEGLS